MGEVELSGADAVRLFSDVFVYLLLLTSYDNAELLRDLPLMATAGVLFNDRMLIWFLSFRAMLD
jgi:hypothetical protein